MMDDCYFENEGFVPIQDTLGRQAWEKRVCVQQDRMLDDQHDDQDDNDDDQDDDNREYLEWIRLERSSMSSSVAADMNVTSCDEVFQQIQEARLEQSRSGSSDLYPRTWRMRTTKATTDTDVTAAFSVAQFNTLAEGLSSGPDAPKPFPNNNNKQQQQQQQESAEEYYGGFSSLDHPAVILDFSKRRWRLLEAILGDGGDHDGGSLFDLIGLQEVDRYHGFFAPVLALFGYQGIFMPKRRSPCVPKGWYSDGCSLFWKTETFDLLSQRRLDYRVGKNQLAILATLRHLSSGKIIVAVVTHLKSQCSDISEGIRNQQVLQLLEAVEEEACKVAEASKVIDNENSRGSVPILILGDFNADPPSQRGSTGGESSSVGQVLKHGRVVEDSNNQSSSLTPLNAKKENNSVAYQSVYNIDNPSEPFWTTWKIRGEKNTRRIIDYIFFAGSIRCTASLDVPPVDVIEPSRLPGLRYPSDHLLIAAKFRFK